jgi:hypothetical protein
MADAGAIGRARQLRNLLLGLQLLHPLDRAVERIPLSYHPGHE